MYAEGYVYHIKDEYFKKANDDKLMQNKENGQYRPTYFCIKDDTTSLLWVVPMSSRYEKYQQIAEKQSVKYGKSLGIVLGEYDGKKAAFLVQNMFPITEKYLDHIHTRNGNPVPVKHSLQETIKSHVQQARLLLSKGKKVVFPDVSKLEKLMIDEILSSQSHSEARRASQSKNKGNSPKKKQVAKKAVSVAPAKRSEKQEQRSSVLGDIESVKKELEQQRREAPTKEKHISKKNNIEI